MTKCQLKAGTALGIGSRKQAQIGTGTQMASVHLETSSVDAPDCVIPMPLMHDLTSMGLFEKAFS
jgi:hypothetical protein